MPSNIADASVSSATGRWIGCDVPRASWLMADCLCSLPLSQVCHCGWKRAHGNAARHPEARSHTWEQRGRAILERLGYEVEVATARPGVGGR